MLKMHILTKFTTIVWMYVYKYIINKIKINAHKWGCGLKTIETSN